MADPASAAARHVDELTDVALPGLPMTDVDRVEDELLAASARIEGECDSCGEGDPADECPNSLRSCGHHCNHIWSHDHCHWCGFEEGAES